METELAEETAQSAPLVMGRIGDRPLGRVLAVGCAELSVASARRGEEVDAQFLADEDGEGSRRALEREATITAKGGDASSVDLARTLGCD